MAWNHPDVSLDDLISLVKGFIDMLILASGYRSSGQTAIWDVDNIKKLIHWGIYFENVLNCLRETDYLEDSTNELDEALLSMSSNPLFPQGLIHVTSASLSNARYLVLERLLEAHPLKEDQILAIFTAVIETDMNNLHECNDDIDDTQIYIDRLKSKIESITLVSTDDDTNDSTHQSFHVCSTSTISKHIPNSSDASNLVDNLQIVTQEVLRRQASESCLSSLGSNLDNLLKIAMRNDFVELENNPLEKWLQEGEMSEELYYWNQWKAMCLSYLLDRRTIKLLSGAKLIFSAPKLQWIHIFECLKLSTDANADNLLEVMEILLLGLISCRWGMIIEHLNSQFCNFLPISKQFSDLQQLFVEYDQSLQSGKEAFSSEHNDILEYLMQLLNAQPCKLWEVHPVLVAAAFPIGSILFRVYFNDLEKHFNGASSALRCCSCIQEKKDHNNCEIAARKRHMVRKLQSELRQTLKKLRVHNKARFGYDLDSYFRNFDDGFLPV